MSTDDEYPEAHASDDFDPAAYDDAVRVPPSAIGERTADQLALDTAVRMGALGSAQARVADGAGSTDDLATVLWGNSFAVRGAEFVARLEARVRGDEKPLPTPWPTLNRALTGRDTDGGFWPGLHFLVGGTGAGKTQFAMQCALEAAKRDVPVLYVNLELAPLDLFARMAALLTGQKWSKLWNGTETLATEGDPIATLQALPFHWIDAARGWDYTKLVPHTEALRLHHNTPKDSPVLVVVDFLQLMGGPKEAREELRERITSASYACRTMARDHSAVVLAVSSIAREHYQKVSVDTGKKKTLTYNKGTPEEYTKEVDPIRPWDKLPGELVGLGKESGDLEFSADSVLVLCQEKWTGTAPPKDGTPVHLAVAKLRAGAGSWVDLRFNGSELTEGSARPTLGTALDHDGLYVKNRNDDDPSKV